MRIVQNGDRNDNNSDSWSDEEDFLPASAHLGHEGAFDCEFNGLSGKTPFDIVAEVTAFDTPIERSREGSTEQATESSMPIIASYA